MTFIIVCVTALKTLGEFVDNNTFVDAAVNITRGDFIILGGDFFLHGGDFVLPGANDTTADGRLCPVLFSPGGGHCPGHVLPPGDFVPVPILRGARFRGPTYHRTPAVIAVKCDKLLW